MNRHLEAVTRVVGMGLLLSVCALALAQGGAALMDPASKVYVVATGQALASQVRITNPAPTPQRFRLYLSDWNLNAGGNFDFFDSGTLERSASSWVTFPDSTVELAGFESRDIAYTVNVPADAEPGTHWTVLFAEGEPSEPEPGQTAAAISVRVGHIIYVNVPELRSEGSVVGLFGAPPTAAGRPYTVIAQYLNSGNAAQGVGGAFTLRNDRGETVIEATIDKSVVLPGGERAFQVNVMGPLPAGNYTALVVLNYGDDERDVAGSYDFLLSEPLGEPDTEGE